MLFLTRHILLHTSILNSWSRSLSSLSLLLQFLSKFFSNDPDFEQVFLRTCAWVQQQKPSTGSDRCCVQVYVNVNRLIWPDLNIIFFFIYPYNIIHFQCVSVGRLSLDLCIYKWCTSHFSKQNLHRFNCLY